FTPEDLQALEKRMKQIIKGAQQFSRRVVESVEAAKEELADEPFKLELVDLKSEQGADAVDTSEVMEVGAGELTIYDNLDPRTKERVWRTEERRVGTEGESGRADVTEQERRGESTVGINGEQLRRDR